MTTKPLLKELENANTIDEVKALKRLKALMSMQYITPEDLT
jgi:hypothetical protein